MTIPWLTVLAGLPAVGALALIFIRGGAAKQVALVFALLTAALAVYLGISFRPGAGMQFGEDVTWIKALGAHYALGLDGIGLTLVILAVIVTPMVVIASWNDFEDLTTTATGSALAPKYDPRVFFALVLLVESCALYLFLATDVFLFYVFFEVILVPMYFLIGGFGG